MSAPYDSHDLCSDHGGENPTIWHLPVPQSLKDEWLRLETRRHFLGRCRVLCRCCICRCRLNRSLFSCCCCGRRCRL